MLYTQTNIHRNTYDSTRYVRDVVQRGCINKGGRPLGVNKHEILPLCLLKWQDEHTKGSFQLPSITSSSIVRWDLTCCVPKRGMIFAMTSFHLFQTRLKVRQALQGSASACTSTQQGPDPVGVVRIGS